VKCDHSWAEGCVAWSCYVCGQSSFVPAKPEPAPYSVPAACQEEPREYVPVWPLDNDPPRPLPPTAAHIMSIGKPAPAPDPRATGIAKAVANLGRFEPRLGASRWEP
jgi:hypothetical protein